MNFAYRLAPHNLRYPRPGITQEVVVAAAHIGVMTLCQEKERTLGRPGGFFRRVAAQLLEALPVDRLFRLLLALLALGLDTGQPL